MTGVSVWIDGAACIGSGTCVRLAQGVFALDDDGVAHLVDSGAADEAQLRLAERSCPTGAIVIEDPTES